MTDPEERLREALAREPRPEPGPFLAARIANRVFAESRRPERRLLSAALRVFGFVLLCAATVFVTGRSRGFAGDLATLALVPAGFGAWLFRREIARELRAAIELLLG